jgi:hypothetical protein
VFYEGGFRQDGQPRARKETHGCPQVRSGISLTRIFSKKLLPPLVLWIQIRFDFRRQKNQKKEKVKKCVFCSAGGSLFCAAGFFCTVLRIRDVLLGS